MEEFGMTITAKVRLNNKKTLTGPERRAPRKVDRENPKENPRRLVTIPMVPSLEKGKPPQNQ
eukprot:12880183-Prorocentrum_lima.AAC.1